LTTDAAFARRNRERCRPRECPARKGQHVPAGCWVEAARTAKAADGVTRNNNSTQCPACGGYIISENWSPVP
jgi:hypothetical protein